MTCSSTKKLCRIYRLLGASLRARYEPLAIIEIFEIVGLFMSRSVIMDALGTLTRRCQVRHRLMA